MSKCDSEFKIKWKLIIEFWKTKVDNQLEYDGNDKNTQNIMEFGL